MYNSQIFVLEGSLEVTILLLFNLGSKKMCFSSRELNVINQNVLSSFFSFFRFFLGEKIKIFLLLFIFPFVNRFRQSRQPQTLNLKTRFLSTRLTLKLRLIIFMICTPLPTVICPHWMVLHRRNIQQILLPDRRFPCHLKALSRLWGLP